MAKAKQVAYLVTDKSPLTYNGKTAACGDIVTDLPGESIAWLLADGFVTPANGSPTPAPAVADDAAPADAEMDGGNA